MLRSRFTVRTLFAVLCALLFSTSAFAQSSAYKPGAPLFVWKVSSKTNTAYLVGSVHLGDQSMYPLPSNIESAFADSSTLIVEVDVTKVDQAHMQSLLAELGMYPQGDDLFRHITPATRQRLAQALQPYNVPVEALARHRPWMVGLTLSILPMMKAGLNPQAGVDMYFLNRAQGKKIAQLEDAAWQLRLMASSPDTDADKYLAYTLDQLSKMEGFFNEITAMWSQGSVDKLEKILLMSTPAEYKQFSRRLIEDRNLPMANRLETCLKSTTEKCFMVVGAAHVVGKEGILETLRARGYTIEQAIVPATKSATASAN